ncbi:hypothetical protein ACFWH4_01305 [Streptomyces sp. NPDC127091]|uniref:hypothetical protein n=1 Tax=Streptomyces sp. NPDC127091 TaxID=3347134 RepID=UPI0036463C12
MTEPADQAATFTAADLVAALRSAGTEKDKLHQSEMRELRRKLAAAERIRENADFHLGQEMARRQLAEKETARLRAEKAVMPQPAALTDIERQFLGFALDLAADEMASRGDEFNSDDEAALEKLRRTTSVIVEAQQNEEQP